MSILRGVIRLSPRWMKGLILTAFAFLPLISSATVLYGGSRQALWIANSMAGQEKPSCFLTVNTIVEYLPRQLQTSTAPSPHLVNQSAALSNPTGLSFDPAGNLWVVSNAGPSILEYSQSQLRALHSAPAPTPLTTITSASFQVPNSLIFDHAGNLWITDLGRSLNPALFEFTPGQQAAGGNLIPNLTMTSLSLLSPGGMAIDHAGNLWVANVDVFLPFNALEFTAAQLAAGGQQSPNVTLGIAVQEPINLAFDHHDNLWVNDWSGNRVLMFRGSALKASGSPSPDIILSAAALSGGENSLASPDALAFDASGNLWVANSYPGNDCTGSMAEFTPAELTASGSPQPAKYITADAAGTSPVGVTAMAFGPPIR